VRKPKSTARRIVNTDLAGDLDMSKNCNPDPGARTCDRATISCALDLELEANGQILHGAEFEFGLDLILDGLERLRAEA